MGIPFPVTDSMLSARALAEIVLPEYGLTEVSDIRLYQSGFNDTYVATLDNGDVYYIRAYRCSWRTHEDALCELDAIEHLRRKGVPVAYPVARLRGGFLTEVQAPEGLRDVAVFVEAKGRMLTYKEDAEALCRQYGAAVAAMHNAWEDFASPHERFRLDLSHLIDTPIHHVAPLLTHRPNDLAYIKAFAEAVKERIIASPDLEIAYCHGDLQGFHAHQDANGRLTFYDFDCGGFGYRAYDLAVFRWSFRFDDQESARWDPFLAAYTQNRSIRQADLDAVPLFVCARHIWHMGVHAQNGPTWGYGALHDGYFDRRLSWLRALASDYQIEVVADNV